MSVVNRTSPAGVRLLQQAARGLQSSEVNLLTFSLVADALTPGLDSEKVMGLLSGPNATFIAGVVVDRPPGEEGVCLYLIEGCAGGGGGGAVNPVECGRCHDM